MLNQPIQDQHYVFMSQTLICNLVLLNYVTLIVKQVIYAYVKPLDSVPETNQN